MRVHRAVGIALLGAGVVIVSCREPGGSVPESRASATRIAELRTRFRLPSPAVSAGLVARRARVALPTFADGEVELEDEISHVAVRFALENVRHARIEMSGDVAIYRGALDGADVVHHVHAEGTEDFVIFEERPVREELRYSVDVSRAPGLRLVSNTLEVLDESGTPLLRVAPPYVVDARGQHHQAQLVVTRCTYDTSPAGPWGRSVTKPGAERCALRVSWGNDIVYPAMVDPAWTTTGSMATTRAWHTATLLPSGKVLVIGGYNSAHLSSAELYDPSGNAGAGTFAATGSMATPRGGHSATLLLTGKVLVAGGYTTGKYSVPTAELYDPAGDAGAGSFVPTGLMSTARASFTASLLPAGKVLVAGGYDGVDFFSSAELFDPAGNGGVGSFTATGSMTTTRHEHTASVLPSGKVLIAGGWNGSALASAELFDPAGNAGEGTFAATGSMTAARLYHTATALPSGKVLVAGGENSTATLASAELFDPAGNGGAGNFVATGSMASARQYYTATLLPSGSVLVAGGSGGIGSSTSAELFDASGNGGAGAFSSAASMAIVRKYHAATLLPSGKVLITGSRVTGNVLYSATAELFDPTLGNGCTASGSCLSGFCADGFCCNAACNGGGCDRCDLAGKQGTCSLAPSGNPGANAACVFPLSCDGVSPACPTSCTSDAACAAAYYCATSSTCQPRKPQAATCNTQLNCRQPACRECASGSCINGSCCDQACEAQSTPPPAATNARPADAAAPAADAVPPPAEMGSDGGCSVALLAKPGDPRRPVAWLAAAAGLVSVSLRRRRSRPRP